MKKQSFKTFMGEYYNNGYNQYRGYTYKKITHRKLYGAKVMLNLLFQKSKSGRRLES